MSSPSGLWRDRKLPGSSRSLRQAGLRGRKHHDQRQSVQQRFFANMKALVIAFQEAGNPFDEDSHEVVIIDTREVMPDNVASSIMGAHGEGNKQHADFVDHRLGAVAGIRRRGLSDGLTLTRWRNAIFRVAGATN